MNNYLEKVGRLFFVLVTFIAFPILYILILKRRKVKKATDSPRVLFIPQLTRVGDLVCATPAFRAVKIVYPKGHVAVLVSSKVAGIIKNNPRIDEVIIYEDYSFWQLVRKIRECDFDWSFSLSATSTSTLISLWGLVANRAKTTRLSRPVTELLTDWMNDYKLLYKDHTYLPRHHLGLLSFMDIENPEEIKEVFITAKGNEKTKEFLSKNGVLPNDTLVGISVLAGNTIKEWGDANFLELAEKVSLKHNAKIVFVGSPNDEQRIDALMKRVRKKDFFKAVNFSLEELPSLFKRLNLFIAVDTGPIYIAHALGVPLIDIIGPVDSGEQPPKDEKSLQVLPDSAISPSSFVFKKRGSPEDIKKAVMSIRVENVLSSVGKLLNA